jgi:alkylated DNA nucleotide flippase Atl1
VAAICGKPKGARLVGHILRNLDNSGNLGVPWWRVLNNRGEISIKGNWTADKQLQASLLRKDGIEVSKDLKLDIKRYRYGK